MFAALGAAAWGAAMFHLTTHAAFKALLFLAAGSVIHGCGTQDMREMGGLARSMPLTAVCWSAGAFALSGWWPFAGFFSKDAVLAAVSDVSPAAAGLLVATSALTALYVWRATALAFFGASRSGPHAHEPVPSMTGPVAVLAVGALVLGWVGGPLFEALGSPEPHAGAGTIAGAMAAVATGTVVAFVWYARDAKRGEAVATGRLWDLARRGFGIDAALEAVAEGPVFAVAAWVDKTADRRIVAQLAEGIGKAARAVGAGLSKLQSGETDVYASFVAVGFVVLSAIVLWAGGR
jgi:NADH-quinone oxidoreductase subunit L